MIKEVHGGNIYKFDHRMYDFSANLNPLGMPEEVKKAIVDHIDQYESYPDPFNRELTGALSRFHGVEEKRICCGNGAADIIFRAVLSLKPKRAMIVSPTFSEYGEALEAVQCRTDHYFLTEENGFVLQEDILQRINRDYDMLFICSPNNPTGVPVIGALMRRIAEKCLSEDVILMVDECFMEFLEEEDKYSLMGQIENFPNLIILKAFTKIYAMAGIRLGYGICGSEEIAEKICSTLQPWSVSTVASKAGVAALKLNGFIEKTKAYIKENRQYLTDGMRRLGYKVYDTQANYIFFRSEKELAEPLERCDIMIRSCANYITLDEHYYRIAVRTREENAYFLRCLARITERNEEGNDGKNDNDSGNLL